jgi:hypothetical protein
MAEKPDESLDDAMSRWTAGVLECRAEGYHPWRRLSVAHRPGVLTVFQRCPRCRNERERDINEQGYPLTKWRRSYREGFLLRGLGRLDHDDKAHLMIASLQQMEWIEVDDEEAS